MKKRRRAADDSTSSSLLRGAVLREPDAWTRMVELYSPLIRHWCRQAGLVNHDIPDVSQEIFAAVAAKLSVFDPGRPGTFYRAWMRGTARNKLRDHFARREVSAAGGSEVGRQLQEVPSPSCRLELSETPESVAERYRRALNLVRDEFEPRTWNAFWRTAVDGQPAPNVAEELGISPNAVRQAKSCVLRRLKQELGELIEVPPDANQGEPTP